MADKIVDAFKRIINRLEEKENKQKLLLEYYSNIKLNSKYTLQIRAEGKDQYPPHVHIYDGLTPDNSKSVSIEVRIPDYEIMAIKKPKGLRREWSNFPDVNKAFFGWLSNLENQKLLLTTVINCNPYNKHIEAVKYELENILQAEQKSNNNLENN